MSSNEWREVKLGETATIKGGKRLPKGKSLSKLKNSHPYIRVRDIGNSRLLNINDNFEYVDDDTQKTISRYIVNTNDILISIVGTIGLIAKVGETLNNANLTENCAKIINLKEVDSDYLYYFLISEKGQAEIKKATVGAVQAKLPLKNIQSIKMSLPALLEQRTIAATLSCLDDMIELNNRTNQILEEIAQAIFKHWFIDFEFPNEDGEPYKSNGGEMVDSELGEIPKGWRIGNIGDYVKIKSGYAFKSSWWTEKGIPVIKIKEIDNYTINFNDISYVADDKAELAKIFKVNSGDLLIAMTGATIGKFAIVPAILPFALVNQRVGKFFLGDRPLERLGFIYCILKEDSIYSEIVSRGDGSAQPNISPSMIESIKIILPSSNIINSYNQQVMNLFKLIIENISENKLMNSIRDTLLPKLMSGEIRVPVEEVV